jgi:murein L,D-transpeptidase YafK
MGVFFTLALIGLFLFAIFKYKKDIWHSYFTKTKEIILKKSQTIERNITITKYRYIEEKLPSKVRLKIALAKSNFIRYPKKITILAFKTEKRLEVWGLDGKKWVNIKNYRWTGYSGRLGPKLKEGDGQIPEGIYNIEYLNPNSKFHLSMKISYPNSFDKKMAKRDKRTKLGGDIMIHGSNKSVGCIPIGDRSIEEVYFLAQKVGIKNIKVIISPVDFRSNDIKIKKLEHSWINTLYKNLKREVLKYRR